MRSEGLSLVFITVRLRLVKSHMLNIVTDDFGELRPLITKLN